jgi:hypothetical protein
MKKKINKEVILCDSCEKEVDYAQRCDCCGIELCYECGVDMMVDYSHSVYCSGSSDGKYCHSCDTKLSKSRENKLHNAYVKIRSLRNEQEAWYIDFKKRSDNAEKNAKELRAELEE